MKLPIALAWAAGSRARRGRRPCDLLHRVDLGFRNPPGHTRFFPAVALGPKRARRWLLTAVYNAANEEAAEAFPWQGGSFPPAIVANNRDVLCAA